MLHIQQGPVRCSVGDFCQRLLAVPDDHALVLASPVATAQFGRLWHRPFKDSVFGMMD